MGRGSEGVKGVKGLYRDNKKNIINPVTVKAILTKKIKNAQNEIHK